MSTSCAADDCDRTSYAKGLCNPRRENAVRWAA